MLIHNLYRDPIRRYLLLNESDDGGAGGGGGGGAAKWTDEDLGRHKAQAIEEGRRKAERDLAEKLGVPVDEAAKLIADAKERADREKDELTKANEARIAAEQAAQQAQAERDRLAADHANTVALVAAGVNPTFIDDARKLLDVPTDADEAARTAAVAALKERHGSTLFTTAAAPQPPAGGAPTPPPPPGHSGGGQSALDKGAEAYKRQHAA